ARHPRFCFGGPLRPRRPAAVGPDRTARTRGVGESRPRKDQSMANDQSTPRSVNRLPLWLKLAYTAFVAVLVPVYWRYYGPTNFLYFCDTALIITLVGIWIESPLLVSMCAVGILAPQVLWVVDFLGSLVGVRITGMTDYMF